MSLYTNDKALRQGLGKIKPIASTYSVYRIGGASGVPNDASSIINEQNLVTAYFPGRFNRITNKSVLEQEDIYKMCYIGEADIRSLKIGDILIETAPHTTDAPDGRAFAFVDCQPLMPAVFARTEIMGSVSRPNSDEAEEPMLGTVPYQGTTKGSEEYLVLGATPETWGYYSFESTGIMATIPFGLQPYSRLGTAQEYHYPTATKRGIHYAYLPLLPGVLLQPGDVLNAQNGDRFRIENLSVFTTGTQGYLAICESLFI